MSAPPTTYQTALDAHNAGLCVIRARTDGTKAPQGNWAQYQTERPTLEQIDEWFADGHPGIGIVCGEISGNLEMLELEGVAVAGGVARAVMQAAKQAGISHLLDRILNGYYEVTPSDGVHWLYKVTGAPVPGNTKLARRNATDAELAIDPTDTVKTLIETRGEGGFTIIAPSHGQTHPTGGQWAIRRGGINTIPTLTAEERDQLHAICRQIDTYTPDKIEPVAPTTKKVAVPRSAGVVGESWYDAVSEHLAASVGWDQLLDRYGWTHVRQDRHGSDLWRRPGKEDDGAVSAWIKNDRLNVFSTSTPLDSTDRTTLDRLDVIAAYEHRNDRDTAARAIADQTGIMAAWQSEQDAIRQPTAPVVTSAAIPGNIDPETGELVTAINLPDEFWNARPTLQHIRQAAWARNRCADAVLIATLGRIATLVAPNVVLPAIVGSEASLNFFGAIVAESGGGKTTSVGVARRLVPIRRTDIIDPLTPGSGEGLIDAYFEMVTETDDEGKKRTVKRKTKTAAYVVVDEGQALLAQRDRNGSTIMQTIRSAWSGADLGQHNAAEERRRVMVEHSYRMCMVLGFQLRYAADLIADAEGGTPQRFVFAPATDPNIPDDAPEWPGPLPWDPPASINGRDFTEITVDAGLAAWIRRQDLERNRGERHVDELDSHAILCREKVAAILGILDGRMTIQPDDWELAGAIMDVSDLVRGQAISAAKVAAAMEAQDRIETATRRAAAEERDAESRALKAGAKAIARCVHRADGETVDRGAAARSIAGRDRALVPLDDMADRAVGEGWIQVVDGGWIPGESRPI